MESTASLEAWRARNKKIPYEPLTDDQLLHMLEWSALYGCANCWSGTAGHGAMLIRQLMREREWLLLKQKVQS